MVVCVWGGGGEIIHLQRVTMFSPLLLLTPPFPPSPLAGAIVSIPGVNFSFQCYFTSTETIRLIRAEEPRTATSTFTQLLNSTFTQLLNSTFTQLLNSAWSKEGVLASIHAKNDQDEGLGKMKIVRFALCNKFYDKACRAHLDVPCGAKSKLWQTASQKERDWRPGRSDYLRPCLFSTGSEHWVSSQEG